MKYPKEQVAESLATLRKLCPPGTTIYTILKHVSRSGMQREISCYVMEEGEPRWISWYVARVLGEPMGQRDGVKVNGCGMDMGFHIVYSLAYALHREGFDCIGEGCPSNDHSNGDRNREPHRHSDPGYSLKHSWL